MNKIKKDLINIIKIFPTLILGLISVTLIGIGSTDLGHYLSVKNYTSFIISLILLLIGIIGIIMLNLFWDKQIKKNN